jgi:Fic family protein
MMWENIIEYIPAKSEDLDYLMDNLLYFYNKNIGELNPILLSTILSTQFVLIHPFMDWNWRNSRFLFQFALLNSWISLIWENKIILPVSAYIQLNKSEYYKNIENISKKLLDFVEFEEYGNWEIKVLNDTKNIYGNIDFTNISNYFYEILNKSINIDYKKELNYIKNFYQIYTLIDSKFNINSQDISFITKNILWNNWILIISKKKILEKKWINSDILEKIEKEIKNINFKNS